MISLLTTKFFDEIVNKTQKCTARPLSGSKVQNLYYATIIQAPRKIVCLECYFGPEFFLVKNSASCWYLTQINCRSCLSRHTGNLYFWKIGLVVTNILSMKWTYFWQIIFKTIENRPRTQCSMEKSQWELKRTRLKNRKYKTFSELAIQYEKLQSSLLKGICRRISEKGYQENEGKI